RKKRDMRLREAIHFLHNDPESAVTSKLSLHDDLPIYEGPALGLQQGYAGGQRAGVRRHRHRGAVRAGVRRHAGHPDGEGEEHGRSEEHTSELQSRFDIVCRLLLEEKKEINNYTAKQLI